MSTRQYRERLREAGRQLTRERQRERFAESLAAPEAVYVFARLPRCPACGSSELRSRRSIDQGDGSRKRWTTCKICNETFFLILE
jgi:hypothetical protein